MRIHRLTLPRYVRTALSGEGTLRVGGRWTPVGLPAVYASDSIALAVLETLVHASSSLAPAHRVVVVELPDGMDVTTVEADELPEGWRATPAPLSLRIFGREWIEASATAVMKVPSAIVPAESNFVLNPLHPEFARLAVVTADPFEIDVRLFR